MRRFLLISVAVILGSIGLMAGYVMWDYDPDNLTPTVSTPSFMAIFDEAVKSRSGKSWEALEAERRARVLEDILTMRNAAAQPAREVALHMARTLAAKDDAVELVARHLGNLSDEEYEVAVGSLAALGTPKATALLDSIFRALDANPVAHTPIGGYRTGSFVVSEDGSDLSFEFQERSRNDADYTLSKTREIALFFPAAPEYLFAVPNVDDVLDRFDESRFMKALDGSPVPRDAWSLPILRTLGSLRARLDETMGVMAPYFSPERFFRDDLVFAKYGEEYMIASFKDKNVEVAEALMSIFSKLGRDFGIRKWQVDGETIATVQNLKSGRTLNYAVIGDYFLVATDTALIGRGVRTFRSNRGGSIAIDPLFNKSFSAIDQSGDRHVFFGWVNPTTFFEITGSSDPAGRRRAVVARALGRTITRTDGVAEARSAASAFPGAIGHSTMAGDDPTLFWRYIVDVRSLGKNPIDSLARLAKMDVGKQIIPYFTPAITLGYAGVDHLKREYGYSNTAFNLLAALPLRSAPRGFDSTLGVFFSRITSLVYNSESFAGGAARLWIARDTTTNDSLLRERKLQPSFAVINGNILVVASTPTLLRSAAGALAGRGSSGASGTDYFSGIARVDSFATNASAYLKGYLMRGDRYTPEEIATRIDPLARALGLYDRLEWSFTDQAGLRQGKGRLIAKR